MITFISVNYGNVMRCGWDEWTDFSMFSGTFFFPPFFCCCCCYKAFRCFFCTIDCSFASLSHLAVKKYPAHKVIFFFHFILRFATSNIRNTEKKASTNGKDKFLPWSLFCNPPNKASSFTVFSCLQTFHTYVHIYCGGWRCSSMRNTCFSLRGK